MKYVYESYLLVVSFLFNYKYGSFTEGFNYRRVITILTIAQSLKNNI